MWSDTRRRAALCQPLPSVVDNLAQRRKQLAFWQHVLEHAPAAGHVVVDLQRLLEELGGGQRLIHCLPEVLQELEAAGRVVPLRSVLQPRSLASRVVAAMVALVRRPAEENEYVIMSAVEALVLQVLAVGLARAPPVWSDAALRETLAAELHLTIVDVDVVLVMLRHRQQCVTLDGDDSHTSVHRFAREAVGPPRPADAAIAATATAMTRMQAAVAAIEQRMAAIRESARRLASGSSAARADRDPAARVLAVRMLAAKKRLEQLSGQLHTLEEMNDSLCAQELNVTMLSAVHAGTATLKSHSALLREAEEVIDSLQESLEDAGYVTEELARPGLLDPLDEAALTAELDALLLSSDEASAAHPSPASTSHPRSHPHAHSHPHHHTQPVVGRFALRRTPSPASPHEFSSLPSSPLATTDGTRAAAGETRAPAEAAAAVAARARAAAAALA